MNRRVFVILAILVLAGCKGTPETAPTRYCGIEKVTLIAKGME